MGIKSWWKKRKETKKELGDIFRETYAVEQKKAAKERAIIKVQAIKEKALYRAKNPPLKRFAKGLVTGVETLGKLQIRDEAPRGRAKKQSGFGFGLDAGYFDDAPKQRRKSKQKVVVVPQPQVIVLGAAPGAAPKKKRKRKSKPKEGIRQWF